MKIIFLILMISYFGAKADDLSTTIRDTFKEEGKLEIIEELKPELLKIEFFLNSEKIKNQNAIFQTEFINYTLKNPIIKEITRHPFKKETIKNELESIELKLNELSPISKNFALKITSEIRGLAANKQFATYLERIVKSYYFTSEDLKIIDKKMRFIEPWWKFYLNSSAMDINLLFLKHLKNFIVHFSNSTEFILNSPITITPNTNLVIFSDQKNEVTPIEQKLEEIIEGSEQNNSEPTTAESKISNQLNEEWSPKDEIQANLDSFQNLNLPPNYPKPSPNYIGPEELPIPMNDW